MFNHWIVVRQYKIFLITLLINFVFCDSNFALIEIFNHLSIVSLRWKKFSLQGDHQYQISRKFIFPPVFRWKSQVSQWPFLQSHMDDRLHRGWGREQKGWQNGKKDKQKKIQKKRERERDTHIHIFTHALARTMTIIMTI